MVSYQSLAETGDLSPHLYGMYPPQGEFGAPPNFRFGDWFGYRPYPPIPFLD